MILLLVNFEVGHLRSAGRYSLSIMRIKPSPVKILTEDNDIVTRKGLCSARLQSHLAILSESRLSFVTHLMLVGDRGYASSPISQAYNRIEMRDPSR